MRVQVVHRVGRAQILQRLKFALPSAIGPTLINGCEKNGRRRPVSLDPDEKNFTMFIEKSDASLAPPVGEVVRPEHVRLLDHEIELGPVIGPRGDGRAR